jgi:hypothetical protein
MRQWSPVGNKYYKSMGGNDIALASHLAAWPLSLSVALGANLIWVDEHGQMVHGHYPDPEQIRRAFR